MSLNATHREDESVLNHNTDTQENRDKWKTHLNMEFDKWDEYERHRMLVLFLQRMLLDIKKQVK